MGFWGWLMGNEGRHSASSNRGRHASRNATRVANNPRRAPAKKATAPTRTRSYAPGSTARANVTGRSTHNHEGKTGRTNTLQNAARQYEPWAKKKG